MTENIPVTRSSMPPFEEYVQTIQKLWDSRWLTNAGAIHEQFKQQLQEYLAINGVALFVNGHLALECVLESLGLQGEVITTPFTFASTTHALVRKGLRPVFCDILDDDFTLDPSRIESLITERTCAIVPVHVYGNICDVERIDAIAKKHGLKVIYDAAHAFGETFEGRSVACLGDASMFSLHATKVFNSIEGGIIATEDLELIDRVDNCKNFGIRNAEEVDGVGTNAKMNEFSAAMGVCNLRYLNQEIEARGRVARCYREELGTIAGIQLNTVQERVTSNHSYFPLVVHEDTYGHTRNDLFERLAREGIHARKYFYPLTSKMQCYASYGFEETPIASRIADRVLTLPIYAGLDLEDVRRICEIVRNFA